MPQLKILHINTHDEGGGAATVAKRLSEAQVRAGHHSGMLVGHKNSAKDSSVSFPIEPNKAHQALCKREGYLSYEFQGSHKLVDYPLVRDCDLIHLHNLHGNYFNPFSVSGISHFAPVIWTLHDMQAITGHCAHAFDCNLWENGCSQCRNLDIEPAIEQDTAAAQWRDKKLIYDHSNLCIVTPSKWLKQKVEKSILKNHPVDLIYNGVDTSKFRPFEKAAVRKKYGITSNSLVVGSVAHGGALSNQWKGGNYIENILGQMKDKYPDVVFLNIGSSAPSNDANILSIAHIDDENELAQVYSLLDIFLYTPIADNCPLVILEALACGVPIVTFDIGGIPELVRNEEDGFVIPGKDIGRMVQSSELLLSDAQLRDRFSRNARVHATSKFDHKNMHQQYMNLYLRCIERHASNTKTIKPFPLSEIPDLIKTPAFLKTEAAKATLQNREGYLINKIQTKKKNVLKRKSGGAKKYCLNADNFHFFTYSKKYHFEYFDNNDLALYDKKIHAIDCDLKVYQDLLVYTFIRQNVPKDSIILEVGGGKSRVLNALKNDYECWNIDKLEGRGSGPIAVDASGYNLVKAYMGDFSAELPDHYFDFVFSISALEHVREEKNTFHNICLDIDRVLKPGGYSLHCFDIVLKKDGVWTNNLLPFMFNNCETINPFIPLDKLTHDSTLYFMSKQAYVRGWQQITKQSYEEFGKPISYNVLWKKQDSDRLRHDVKNMRNRQCYHIENDYKNLCKYSEAEINKPIVNAKSKAPRITIVTPSYNQGEFLEECIDSILSQNYPNLEYIIMDGGSVDGSVEIIQKYQKYLTHWQSQADGGQYAAINRGFVLASGEIMAWLNSDDKYHPDSLFKAAYIFEENPEVEWITGRPTAWNEKGDLVHVFEDLPLWNREKYLKKAFKRICIQQESTFWRETLWEKSGAYLKTELQFAGDLELWMRFFRFAQLFTVDTLLGGYRYQPNQKTHLNLSKYIKEGEGIIDEEIGKIRVGRFSEILPAPLPLPFNKCQFEIYKDNIFHYQKKIHNREFKTGYRDRSQRNQQNNSPSNSTAPKANIAPEKSDKIFIATSIAPKEIDLQIQAIISWRKLGFNVVSINCQEEIDMVQKFFPDVQFHPAKRHAKKLFGKPCIYFDDILGYFLENNIENCGIVNSDIHLFGDDNIFSFVRQQSQNAVLYGHRVEIESLENLQGNFYDQGFDFFFFPKSIASCFPRSELCLGATWWDYWAALIPALEGFKLKQLVSPFAYHLTHPIRYDDKQWNFTGEFVWEYLNEKNRESIDSPDSTMRWSIFDSVISSVNKSCRTDKCFNTLSSNKKRFSKLEHLAVGIQNFLKKISAPILYQTIRNPDHSLDRQIINSDSIVEPARCIPIDDDSKIIAVSAIISAFNSERFMHGRLDNLVKQTLYDKGKLEIIIVDSNSSQAEKKIVNEFIKQYKNIEYIYTSVTESVYGAWNRGIRYARGKYIINANTDDRFALDALERMADELDADNGIQAVYGDWLMTDIENDLFESNSKKVSFSYPDFFPPLFLYYQITSHACLLRKEVFTRIGAYESQLKVFGDREFMLRFSTAGLKARKIPFNAGLYLKNRTGLECSNPGAGTEFNSLRDAYIQPASISKLFGYESTPDDKKLAELYAITGSLGNKFYTLDKQSVSDFNFAARLFSKALGLDPANAMALNNLGIVMCLKGKAQDGVRQFEKAIECESADAKGPIRENLQAAKQGATSIENYRWYPCKASAQMFCANKKKRSADYHQHPNITDSESLNESVDGTPAYHPMVSVIVPSFNRPDMLRVALDSLTAQTFKDFEVIVINDGGVNIDCIIDDFKKRLNIQFIDYPVNRNRAAARNNGLRIADSKYIAYLDDDDRLYPEHLEILVNYLESNDCQMAYSDAYRAVEEKRQEKYVVVKRDLPHSTEFDHELLLVRNFIPSLCVMHHKSCLEAVGIFDESLGTHEDWDLWIRISRQFKVAHVNKITGEYSWRSDGSSTTSSRRDDFLQTMQVVYDKHKEVADGNPRLAEMQTNSLENLKKEISATHNSVVCSIIIPAFNKLKFTRRCIESLYNKTSGMRVEVIVVDNNSSDGTDEFLASRQDKLTIITNSSNTGFAKACNQGGRAANGRYVVFLNNDTDVQSGWLDELVKCCRQNDRVGVVGAKLLYADNTIQHAGVAIKNSPHPIFPFHIHRGKPADSPEVNVAQEYQAVTGACMLVRRKLFEQIGGFDEEFINGYEDIDLCFRIREAGYKVVYCPTSVAYHYESVSSGRFAHANHNIKRLHQKWQNKVLPDEDTRLVANKAKLSSIIILTHNQIAFTRKCLDSIYRHTSEPFELVIVDNGSMDGTPAYLESEVVGRRSNVPVNVIKNNDNLGFSAGNNQGIAAARGDYIIFLNNDVVVTQGWLERLIGCADRHPGTAIVGPRTNSIAGPQKMDPVSYDQKSLEGLDDYAAMVAEKFKGQSNDCWRVVGFCMLIKRAVINKIGGLDTRFGLGNFEDDDFCIRARLAGFKARIAEDCFIHHFGGQTFKGADIDYQDSLNKNWEIFKDKWDIPRHTPLSPTYTVIPPRNGFDPAGHFFPLPVISTSESITSVSTPPENKEAKLKNIELLNCDANTDKQNNIHSTHRQGGNAVKPYEEIYRSIQPLLDGSNPENAIAALSNLVKSFPDFSQAHNDLGVLYHQGDQNEKAVHHYEQAAQLEPDNGTFKKNLADFYYAVQGRVEDALMVYEDVLAINPQDVETRQICGHICVALHQFDKAQAFYSRVLEIEPWQAEIREILDKLQAHGSEGANDKSPDEIYQSILSQMEGADLVTTIEALEKLTASTPDFAPAHNDLGVLYYQTDDMERALVHYEQAASLEPGNVTFKKNLADFYYVEQGRVEDALKIYVDLLAINPEDVETLQVCGHICVALQKFEDARVFYNRVLEIEPWHAEAREILDKLNNPGQESKEAKAPEEIYQGIQTEMAGKDPRMVIEALEKLAAAAPDFAPAHNDLGVLYYQSDEKDKALTHYEQAARLEPGNVTFKKNLADFYYVEQGRVEDALNIYVDLLAINPQDIETLQITGHICVALHKFEDAKVFYNRVLEIEPWNAETRDFLEKLQLKEKAV